MPRTSPDTGSDASASRPTPHPLLAVNRPLERLVRVCTGLRRAAMHRPAAPSRRVANLAHTGGGHASSRAFT